MPTLRFVDCYLMDIASSKLVVFTVCCDNVHILVQTGLSSRPSSGLGRLRLPKLVDNEKTMFLMLSACVVNYAYPDEAACFTMQLSEVVHDNIWHQHYDDETCLLQQMPTSHAGCQAWEQAAIWSHLLTMVGAGPLPIPSEPSMMGSTSAQVIDLIVDSEIEADSDLEIEVIG